MKMKDRVKQFWPKSLMFRRSVGVYLCQISIFLYNKAKEIKLSK